MVSSISIVASACGGGLGSACKSRIDLLICNRSYVHSNYATCVVLEHRKVVSAFPARGFLALCFSAQSCCSDVDDQ